MAETENQSTHRVAILSDTHGLLRPEIREILKTCEVILHGGDINSQKILDELKEIAPVYVVRGNNDKEWAANLDKELTITLFGLQICMVHNQKQRQTDLRGTDLFVYGHSHKYEEKTVDGVHFLNPGSCGPRRFRQPVTMAVLEITEESGDWQIQKINLTENEKGKDSKPIQGLNKGNLKSTVETIVKEMRAGRRVELIAERLGVDREFVEQVCRIYVTHPGVSAQGIMDKMEVSDIYSHH